MTSTTPAHCRGYVALTFDDGPNDNTRTLLAALRGAGARATLFNTGENAAKHPELVRAEVEAGMWVANHSFSHPYLTRLDEAAIRDELERTQTAIAAGGATLPVLFRPPYGDCDATLETVATSLGLRVVVWDVDSRDWDGATAAEIVAAAETLEDGGVILMHDWPPATLAAIPEIVAGLARRGLCPGMIDPASGRAVAPR